MKVTTFFKRALATVLFVIAAFGPLAADYVQKCGPSWISEANGAGLCMTALFLTLLLVVLGAMLTYSSFDD